MPQAIDPGRACPWCGCNEVHRSHRRGLIDLGLNRILRISPYRCEDCDRRFYVHETSRRETMDRKVAMS